MTTGTLFTSCIAPLRLGDPDLLPPAHHRRHGLGHQGPEVPPRHPHLRPDRHAAWRVICRQLFRCSFCVQEVFLIWSPELGMWRKLQREVFKDCLETRYKSANIPSFWPFELPAQRHAYGFTGWSMETTKNNLNPNWIDSKLQNNPDFFVTFGVFFTAVTGIVAGANLSGDLKVDTRS